MIRFRELKKEEWRSGMHLAWTSFLKSEAANCEPEGVKAFYRFVTDCDLEKMFLLGEYKAFGAFDNDRMVGIAGVRSVNFLSILFVDEEYHHRHIATDLVAMVVEHVSTNTPKKEIKVYSALPAVEFYRKLGFCKSCDVRTDCGVTYMPMVLTIR